MTITVPAITVNRTVIRSASETITNSFQIAMAICMIAADVAAFIWNNGGQDAAIKFGRQSRTMASILWAWFHNSFIPAVEIACQHCYDSGASLRRIWERLNSPLFIYI